MKTHIMKLQPGPFNAIKSGKKVIESRLFDEKRKLIQIGDRILFKKKPELEDCVEVKVISLLQYPTFADLMNDFPPNYFGGESKQVLLEEIYHFYSIEDESERGVLGIKIKLI